MNLLYSAQHLWARHLGDNLWEIGISDHAQSLLGDIVFIEVPPLGSLLSEGEVCGVVESVKTAADLYAPLTGEVVAQHEAALAHPEWVNEQPEQTWLFKLRANATAQALLSKADYMTLISQES